MPKWQYLDTDQTVIFAPFLAMIWITIAVWVLLFARRIPFISSTGLKPDELTPAELARRAPPKVAAPSDNLKNLFEIPVLFYALVLYLFVAGKVDQTYIILAWVFVAFRAVHSLIHCTYNTITHRFGAYLISCVTLIVMLARATLSTSG